MTTFRISWCSGITAVLIFLASSAELAIGQSLGGAVEQQVLKGSLGAGDSSQESADADALSPYLAICGQRRELAQEIARTCEQAAAQIIASTATRVERENHLALEAQERRARFNTKNEAHLLSALQDQARRGEIIFWVAMAIVALGLIAAALQFRTVWRNQDASQTEINISEKQITIKTAWIGVVLLAMAMVFLALYLTLVYQIEAI